MTGIFALLIKWELQEFLKSKVLIFWNLAFPTLLFVVLVSAFGGAGLGTIKLALIDNDKSAASSLYRDVVQEVFANNDGVRAEFAPPEQAQVVVTLPKGFELSLAGGEPAGVQIRYDGSAGPAQRTAAQILRSVTKEFELRIRLGEGALRTAMLDTGKENSPQISYTQYLATGIVVLTLLSLCTVGIVVPLVARRQYGMLRAFKALPLKRSTYLAAFVGSRLLLGVALATIFLVVIGYVYSLPFRASALSIAQAGFLIVLMTAVFSAIGLAMAGRLESVAAATAAANLVFFPLVFLGNLTIPITGFPDWLRTALSFSPSAIGVSAFRDVLIDGGTLWDNKYAIALLALWGAAAAIVARLTFTWNKS